MAGSLRRIVVVAVVSALAGPWPAGPAHAIAYGEDAPDGDYRFSVRLAMTGLPDGDGGTRDSSCSGALVAPRWVITAGHCFKDARGRRVSRTVAAETVAVVGRTDLDSRAGHEVQVVGVRQAEGADVALAELGEAVTDIAPVRVATAPPRVGEVLRLTGFGLVSRGGPTAPATRLQTGQFTVDAVGPALIETSGRAPRPDTSPCPHDSGGPYFREGRGGAVTLAGVVSSGPDCPHPGPDLSARTDTLAGWIADVTASPPQDRSGVRAALPLVAAAAVAAVAAAVLAGILRWRRSLSR